MNIVVLDGYTLNPGDLSWDGFKALGDFACYDRTEKALIVERIGDADIVITNKTPISAETLDACPGIRYIGVIATGYNVVDTDAAAERGIAVCNIPSYGTESVAQFTFAHLLNICSQVQLHAETVTEGSWAIAKDFCYWNHPLMELHGKTIGIIGYGRIGRAVGRIALGFGMKVLAFSRSRKEELETGGIEYTDLDELYRRSDVISLHCPLFDETRGIINRDSIARMKDGVIILNTSRGPLIVEEDLADALESGKVLAAGVDVVSREPVSADNPLLKARNCYITPHIAWAPFEARSRLMDIAVDNLKSFIAGDIKNRVN